MVPGPGSGREALITRYHGLAALVFVCCACARQASPPPQQTSASPPPPQNRLLFAGDVMLTRDVARQMKKHDDLALPFRKLAPFLSAADLTFVNLESPFSDATWPVSQGLIFHAAPDTVAGLQLAGVDVVSTANNHSRDCGPHGVAFTYQWLKSHGMAPVGSGETAEKAHEGVVLERRGVRFGFLGYTFDQKNGNWNDVDERVAVTDLPVMQRDVMALRKRCDVVVVSMHNGVEYQRKQNAAQSAFARGAIDAGATLVVGHHPHVIQPMERYRDGAIFYSLGNFVFDQYQRQETQHGEIAEVVFQGAKLHALWLVPVRITTDGPELETIRSAAPAKGQSVKPAKPESSPRPAPPPAK